MKQKNTILKKAAKGIKYVAERVDEKNSFTAIGFYKPQKPAKTNENK